MTTYATQQLSSAQVPAEFLKQSVLRQRFLAARERACVHAGTIARWIGGPRFQDAFGILMYHRVISHLPESCPPTWNVSPERFRKQLSGLLNRGLQPRSLSHVLNRARRGETIERNVFVVTFDDGYENNFTHALPILRELHIPATIFLATAYLGRSEPFPFDDWPLKGSEQVPPESWRALSESQCDALLDSGLIEFGSHTHTHEDFRGRPGALVENLHQSAEFLRMRFGIESPTLSLPYGGERQGFSGPDFSAIAETAGLTCCLSTEQRLATRRETPFTWGRFIAEQCDSSATLMTKLSGWPETIRAIWQRLKQT
ncbi:MAG: polysaccharide deacetylase family protein [Planctomycetota bacterium]|nr:polysaccharide deacetylase family protein [Planctomycetota bacterium]